MNKLLFRAHYVFVSCLMLLCCSLSAQNNVSLVSSSVSYCSSHSGKWSERVSISIPIYLSKNKIVLGSAPLGVLNVMTRLNQAPDGKNVTFKCKNSRGTEFIVKLVFSSSSDVLLNVKSDSVEMAYECSVANEKPYYNMADLGLSCKWGISNYYNYSTDIVTATFGAGKRLTYDQAKKMFSSGKQHLPTSKQIKELLTQCSWDFIDNPDDEYHKGYLVTGPNGNSIFLPCNDGGDGNYSSAWYLGANEYDTFLSNALQLNINSTIVYPYDKQYLGCVRLVED